MAEKDEQEKGEETQEDPFDVDLEEIELVNNGKEKPENEGNEGDE